MDLTLNVCERELFNEETCEFITVPAATISLEHSLYTMSLWESKWHKPWISEVDKTRDEERSYFECMSYKSPVDPLVFIGLSSDERHAIADYISDPMTATTVTKPKQTRHSGEGITTELIYYWMSAYHIPFECEHWHFNRLMMLIQIANAKNATDNKMSMKDTLAQNHALNVARRKAARRK